MKDKTRAKILELLEQRGQVSYMQLQTMLEVSHTGKLNYHLKVLGDLISKDERGGLYSLSEKGKVAVTLLGKFQAMSESGAAALKTKLKLGVAIGVTVVMASLSLFFLVVGIPGSAGTIALTCSTGNACSGSSQFTTTFTPTLYAMIPLILAIIATFGFYKRKTIIVWLATAVLFGFSFMALFSIGILYFPFGIALIVLSFVNRRDSHTSRLVAAKASTQA